MPTIGQARRTMQKFARKVVRLEAALADALAPGAARIIAEADLAWENDLTGIDEEMGWGSIQYLGEALAWGLAGADPAVLDRMRAENTDRKAKREAAFKAEQARKLSPVEYVDAVFVKSLASCADVLTLDDRRGIVERIAAALGVEASS